MAVTMAAALLAQPPRTRFQAGDGFPPTPQEMIERHVKRMGHFLALTADQQTQVTNILTADTNNLSTLRDTLKTQREAVVDAIKANSGVSAAVTALSATQGQIEIIRANQAAQIYAILTADQKAKIGDAIHMLAGGGGPGGPGGQGGRGPRGPRN